LVVDDWNGRKNIVVVVAVELPFYAACGKWNHGDCYCCSSADGLVFVVVFGE
jgi:hypothetical protein